MTAGQRLELLRRIGPERAWGRAWHSAILKLGLLKDTPKPASLAELSQRAGRPQAVFARPLPVSEPYLGDPFAHFGWKEGLWDGTWNRNPLSGRVYPLRHWTEIPLYDEQMGDIKWAWEPGRFGWLLRLGRSFLATQDSAHLEQIGVTLRSFAEQCPPWLGVQWACAHEASYRAAGLAWAYGALESHLSSEDAALMAGLLAACGSRIECTLGYGRSQQNTHSLMEGVGLHLVGRALPEHPKSAAWTAWGWAQASEQAQLQFAEDGGYEMASCTYQRLATTHLLLMCAAGGPGFSLPKAQLHASAKALLCLTHNGDGRVPNWGPNDGANEVNFSNCDSLDFRPLIQASFAALALPSPFPPGPWDATALMLGLQPLPQGPTEQPSAIPSAGIFRFGPDSERLYFRSGPVRSLHTHADLLQVDVWSGDVNLLSDGGTFLYCDGSGVGARLKGTTAHCTVAVNGEDQMTPVGRFLWADWADGETLAAAPDRVKGRHFGYRKRFGIIHTREAAQLPDGWQIEDELTQPRNEVELSWLWRVPSYEGWDLGAGSLQGHGWLLEWEGPDSLLATFEMGTRSERYGQLTPCGELRWRLRTSAAAKTTMRLTRLPES